MQLPDIRTKGNTDAPMKQIIKGTGKKEINLKTVTYRRKKQ
jgi:hypothetical protein